VAASRSPAPPPPAGNLDQLRACLGNVTPIRREHLRGGIDENDFLASAQIKNGRALCHRRALDGRFQIEVL